MTNLLPLDEVDTHGFPPGYFVIQSIATNRLLDVKSDSVEDGTGVLLWPEKEKSMVEGSLLSRSHSYRENLTCETGFRDPNANNQVFFIDTAGALCCRSSGHAIDVEGDITIITRGDTPLSDFFMVCVGDRLVLRHRRPVSHPYPNAYSHPLPNFHYDGRTGEITVRFSHNPEYPSSSWSAAGTRAAGTTPGRGDPWRNKTYYLVSQPLRKPRTIIDDASELIATAITSPINLFSSAFGGKGAAKPEEVFDGNIDLKEEEVVDEDRGEEGEVDDSSELERQVRVIGVVKGPEGNLSEKARRRRQWAVSSLRRINARTGAI
jgi:hypothetical protein